MTFWEVAGCIAGGVFLAYVLTRLLSAAVFRSFFEVMKSYQRKDKPEEKEETKQ